MIENEGVVASILEEVGDGVELMNVEIDEKSRGRSDIDEIADKVARFRPHLHHTGGFFIAKFRKIREISDTTIACRNTLMKHPNSTEEYPDPFTLVQPEKIEERLRKQGMKGIKREKNMLFLETKHTVRLAPK